MSEDTVTKTKEMLDDMHKRKMDFSDEIYVINVGCIGASTSCEIEYATTTGKIVNSIWSRYNEVLSSKSDHALERLPRALTCV